MAELKSFRKKKEEKMYFMAGNDICFPSKSLDIRRINVIEISQTQCD